MPKIRKPKNKIARYETVNGKEYYVIHAIMSLAGVRNGALMPVEEFLATQIEDDDGSIYSNFNGRPIVMNHPGGSANKVDLIETHVGFVDSAEALENGELHSETYIDYNKVIELGYEKEFNELEDGIIQENSIGFISQFVNAKGEMQELMITNEVKIIEDEKSTFTRDGKKSTIFEFQGKKYNGVFVNVRADHLAWLTDGKIGAAPVSEGAGIGRLTSENISDINKDTKKENSMDSFKLEKSKFEIIQNVINRFNEQNIVAELELSQSQIRSQLRVIAEEIMTALGIKKGDDDYLYIEDVFETYFAFELTGIIYIIEYKISTNQLEVENKVYYGQKSYEKIGEVSTPSTSVPIVNNQKENQMKIEDIAKKVIALESNEFTDKDFDSLIKLPEKVLSEMAEENTDETENTEEVVEDAPAGDAEVSETDTTDTESETLSAEEVAEFRAEKKALKEEQDKNRVEFDKVILANTPMTENQVKELSYKSAKELAESISPTPNYTGLAGTISESAELEDTDSVIFGSTRKKMENK